MGSSPLAYFESRINARIIVSLSGGRNGMGTAIYPMAVPRDKERQLKAKILLIYDTHSGPQ